MAYDTNLMNQMYLRTGISRQSLEYDAEMSDFINLFFGEVNRQGVNINVYGGTPLNRGFFGERQRLSLDLDLETGSRVFNANTINVRDIIKEIGYKEMRSKLLKESFLTHISKGDIVIKVEMRKKSLEMKTEYVTLHSLLEYYGVPSTTTKAPSYEFECLLASKLHALSRRMIYRDLYDSYIGLQMLSDRGKLVRYVKVMDKKFGTDALDEISGRIRNGDYAYQQAQDTVYEALVPLQYRENRNIMANFVRMKVDGLRKR